MRPYDPTENYFDPQPALIPRPFRLAKRLGAALIAVAVIGCMFVAVGTLILMVLG